MEHRLLSLLQSPPRPEQLKPILAAILRSHPHGNPLFVRLLAYPSTIHCARQMFDAIPQPDPDLCSSIIAALSKFSLHKEVLQTFVSVHHKNAQVSFASLPSVLKSCASLAASHVGRQVHSFVLARGFQPNVFIQTALVDFYSKNGDMDSASKLFDEIPSKDPVPINCLITGYSKSGDFLAARRLFDEMPKRTSSSWNSMIACYAHKGDFHEALRLFEQMQIENARPTTITVVTILSICAKTGDLESGLRVRDLIADYHLQVDMIVRTALLEMYVKCGAVDQARQEFDQMERKDVVAWSAMIAGYAQNGRSIEALNLFERMKAENCDPNEVTLVSVLSACGQLGSVEVGERIGSYIENQGFSLGVYVGSALVDMYAKCGNLIRACRVFNRMHQRDVVTWNSMIAGLAFNGFAEDAIDMYEKMKAENFKPNEITFVALLTACTHAGFVEQGIKFFKSMRKDYNLVSKVEHCACIVDLYCRSGKLKEAYKFICEMEVEPNVVIWGSLLSACRVHSDVELAENAAAKLFVLEPYNSSNYVLLSNIYANAGRWDAARKVRDLMKNRNVQKLAAYSWIELDGVINKFLVEDTSHPKSEEIYEVADGLGLQLESIDYEPNMDIDLLDII